MITKDVYLLGVQGEENPCFGFKVVRHDGVALMVQNFHPHKEGFEPMTEEEANFEADEYVEYYSSLEQGV